MIRISSNGSTVEWSHSVKIFFRGANTRQEKIVFIKDEFFKLKMNTVYKFQISVEETEMT